MTIYMDKKETPEWESKVCLQIKEEWTNGRQYVSKLNDMYDDIYKMIRGGRPEKNYDWQSNFTLRKAFQITWTFIAYIAQKIYGAYPVISVDGFDDKGCWQRERLLEVWMAKDKYFLVLVLGLLRLVLNGTVFIKKGWRQVLISKEQKGTFPVWDSEGNIAYERGSITASIPKEDRPDDVVLNNKDVVVDWMLKPGQDIKEARFIIHREVVDMASLYNSKINYMNLDNVKFTNLQGTDEAFEHGKARSEDDQDSPPGSSLYKEGEVFERQGIWPVKVNKKGKITPIFDKEEIYSEGTEWRSMIATVAGDTLIRWEENPYGEKTYVAGMMYLDSERWDGIGLIEPAKDILVAQDDNVNAMFDEIWRNLMPPTAMNRYAVHEWDSIKHAPGQVWLMQGPPRDNIYPFPSTNITSDAWQKHALLEGEGQLITPVNHNIQGAGQEKTATLGVLNTQASTGKMDFLIQMIEVSWLIPSSEMSLRFAQMFAHPLTFLTILGEPFKFDRFLNEYKFQPAASSVKLPEQREAEIQQDIQLLQIVQAINNPGTPKIMNQLMSNIFRNRNKPHMAKFFDENFFEPNTEAGNLQMMDRMLGAPSNEQGIEMSGTERGMRESTFQPRMMGGQN